MTGADGLGEILQFESFIHCIERVCIAVALAFSLHYGIPGVFYLFI